MLVYNEMEFLSKENCLVKFGICICNLMRYNNCIYFMYIICNFL